VLKGEMSLVGPRPLLIEYLPYYSAEQHRRHSVRPGITGLAQINGRNQTTWAERLGCRFRGCTGAVQVLPDGTGATRHP
jgi:sugar transferase EpsL